MPVSAGSRSAASRLRALLVATPLRHVAGPVHEQALRIELAALSACQGLGARPEPLLPGVARRVTAIIKTFERPRELERLIASLSQLFPGVSAIVADDGREVVSRPGVRTIALPFDSGVSAGRQAALNAVETEYTWVLDDDFLVYWGTSLAGVIATLDRNPQLDIVGGPVVDLPLGRKQDARSSPIYPTRAQPLSPLGSKVEQVIVRDKVPNFFVARSDRLRLVGWDPALKRLDHADFFTRARGVLLTAYDDRFRCLHLPTPFDQAYMARRSSLDDDAAILNERYFA